MGNEMSKWISVKDRLPEDGHNNWVLALSETKPMPEFESYYNRIHIKRYTGNEFKKWQKLNYEWSDKIITHWMPLPEPPNIEEKYE